MSSYLLLAAFASTAILFSFLCSLWESVLLSITPSYAHDLELKGSRVGARLRAFKENIDIPLAAILTLNTIAHTVGAIGVGDQASRIWSEANPLITGLVVPIVMTLAILILSEIIPKTIGANQWQRLAGFTVYSLNILIKLLYPLIVMIQVITRGLRKGEMDPVLTRSQFLTMADVGHKEGVLDEQESAFIKNLLQYREIRAKDVMTPRVVTRMAPQEMTCVEFTEIYPDLRFSRIPIYEDDHPEHIVGYVRKDDVLQHASREDDVTTLSEIKRRLLVVLESQKIPELFDQFLANRDHIALVVDEFGGMQGVVSMEDVIETMLGLEIVDESDAAEDMQELARRNWKQRALRMGIAASDEPTQSDSSEQSETSRGKP